MLEEEEMAETLGTQFLYYYLFIWSVFSSSIDIILVMSIRYKTVHKYFCVQYILDIDVQKDFITCPIPYGGMLLLNNLIPHRR